MNDQTRVGSSALNRTEGDSFNLEEPRDSRHNLEDHILYLHATEFIASPSYEQLSQAISKINSSVPPDFSLEAYNAEWNARVQWATLQARRFPELQGRLIDQVLRKILGVPSGKHGQIKIIQRLVFQRKDAVLVAATGYGKSAILFTVAVMMGKTAIIITPLNALGKDQAKKIEINIPGSNPLFIEAETRQRVSFTCAFTVTPSTLFIY